jgi:hypothetical protein
LSDSARAQVIPELSRIAAIDQFITRAVFQALFTMHSDGAAFRFVDLEGRLSDADRDLLSAAIFADEALEEEKAAEQALACLRSLKSQNPRIEGAALRARIKAAEREGNLEEALRLAEAEARLRKEELDQKSRSATSTALK